MPITTCFEEDHIVPLAATPSALLGFSTLDGGIYWLSSTLNPTYHQVDTSSLSNPYCIIGEPDLYDIDHVGEQVMITVYPATLTNLGPGESHHLSGPDSASFTLQGIVASASDSDQKYLVFGAPSQLKILNISDESIIDIPSQGTVFGIRASGEVFVQITDDLWRSYRGPNIKDQGTGRLVSLTEDTVLTQHKSKTGTDWFTWGPTGISSLTAPNGWTVHSLACGNDTISAYATHQKIGQALLTGILGSPVLSVETVINGTATPYSVGQHQVPVIRHTGLAVGSFWTLPSTTLRGIVPADESISTEVIDLKGLICMKATKSNNVERSLVVSLHGGPDSHELDDLRYNGLYRRLIDQGHSVLIVNYPGSLGFGADYQQQAWLNWDESIQQTIDAVTAELQTHHYVSTKILGVSFGAWIALQVAPNIRGASAIVFSPILNMSDHVQQHSQNDSAFSTWAEKRFGRDLITCRRGDERIQKTSSHVKAYLPIDDEVVPLLQSADALKQMSSKVVSKWVVEIVPGKHYPATQFSAGIRWGKVAGAIFADHN